MIGIGVTALHAAIVFAFAARTSRLVPIGGGEIGVGQAMRELH
ncbi:MAG: hypothetical protein ABL891_11345 [Burkholderiales bacterium]